MNNSTTKTVIVFTQSQKLFKRIRSGLKLSGVQKAGNIEEVKEIAKNEVRSESGYVPQDIVVLLLSLTKCVR